VRHKNSARQERSDRHARRRTAPSGIRVSLARPAAAVGREVPELFSLFLEGNLTLARILGRNQLADDLTRRVEGDEEG